MIPARLTWAAAILGATTCLALSVSMSLPLDAHLERADLVAVIEVVAGDSEGFETWVYRARVVKPIKGSTEGQYVYFGSTAASQDGDETSLRIQGEYVVFLSQSDKSLEQHRKKALGPWREDDHVFYYAYSYGNQTVLPTRLIWSDDSWHWRVGTSSSWFEIPDELDTVIIEDERFEPSTDQWTVEEDFLDYLRRRARVN